VLPRVDDLALSREHVQEGDERGARASGALSARAPGSPAGAPPPRAGVPRPATCGPGTRQGSCPRSARITPLAASQFIERVPLVLAQWPDHGGRLLALAHADDPQGRRGSGVRRPVRRRRRAGLSVCPARAAARATGPRRYPRPLRRAGTPARAVRLGGVHALVRETDDPEVVVTEITRHGRPKVTGEPCRFTGLGVIRVSRR
jgi:hypothetical protein